MTDKKVYPRPPAPPPAESYAFRPSSPIAQLHPPPTSRSFFSRSTKAAKSTTEVAKIPWESSSSSSNLVSPKSSTSSPPPNQQPTVVRPSSPHSIYSYTSSNSSSRWSQNWGNGGVRRRGASAGSSPRDVFRSRRDNSIAGELPHRSGGGGGWSEDEEDIPLSGPGSGKKGSGGKRGMMRAFGLEKKGSSFSLRGLMRRGRDSFDQDFSPPPSPTSPFHPLVHRQQSSPELLKNGNLGSPRTPRSPLLPLPLSPPRDRTISSPTFPSPESAGVKGKAARLLGEEIVPHGKAARLLGVERKPTLRTRPSVASLADTLSRGDQSRTPTASQAASPEIPYPDQVFDTPSSTRSLPLSSIDSPPPPTPPQLAKSTLSPTPKSKHRHNDSASDPFWQSDLAQQHQKAILARTTLEQPIEEEEDTLDPLPTISSASRLSLEVDVEAPGRPLPSTPSDPTDSVYVSGDSPNRSSLYSFSLDLNHVSTFSSMSNFRTVDEEGDSPVENLLSRSSSANRLPRLRTSAEEASRRSQKSSPSLYNRLSYSPTELSPRASTSRLSLNPHPSSANIRHSMSMTAVNLGAPLLPAPSAALPPLPRVVAGSTSVPSLVSCPPSLAQPLPRIPSLEPLPSFISLSKRFDFPLPSPPPDFPLPSSPPDSPPPPPPVPLSTSRTSSKPTRSNTLASVASAGTRRRQHGNALEALEGRRIPGQDSAQKIPQADIGEENEERGSRKRAAGVRERNRAVQQKRSKDASFLDLEGSDESADDNHELDQQQVEVTGEKVANGSLVENGNVTTPEERRPIVYSSPSPDLDFPTSMHLQPLARRDSTNSISSVDSRMSDSSLFSTLPIDVTASSFPRPPTSNLTPTLPYLSAPPSPLSKSPTDL